ncbi:hypothetical protein GHV23_05295 [Proteus mirabilis]|nr:hypothetical protein [Proteus mirabilis]HEK2912070.1 hypothetical protein [Proteus mirabilis]
MIYTTGTVSTVSGSAIVKGTGTKFKNNNPAINIGMTILIKSGNTNIPYMIKSVNSDTELVLAHPALATATNTAFSIHITEPDNNSDAARTMVAINAYTQYFLDAMNTWMSETGQTKIEMPNGEVITLDSIKKMQGDIGSKADLNLSKTQSFTSAIEAITKLTSKSADGKTSISLTTSNAGGTSIELNSVSGYNGIQIPKLSGTMVLVGQYGSGSKQLSMAGRPTDMKAVGASGLYGYVSPANLPQNIVAYGDFIHLKYDANNWQNIIFPNYGDYMFIQRTINNVDTHVQVMTSNMWTTDSNGFYKRASPIIDINPDGSFTTNDESEGATVTRVAKGEYLIEGVLGFNADAGWGGVDGGIEIPLDVNKQPLIWVNSKVNKDGSILVKTYHRTHPNVPEFACNDIDGYSDGDPIDIPYGRFISVRVQMSERQFMV